MDAEELVLRCVPGMSTNKQLHLEELELEVCSRAANGLEADPQATDQLPMPALSLDFIPRKDG